jgi:uncharacterized membrane protein
MRQPLFLARLREAGRGAIWPVPAFALVSGSVIAECVVLFDEALAAAFPKEQLFIGNGDVLRTMLGTIAAAMLTFLGVVFSISIVALQLASSQFSPRILRTFVRARVTKLTFGTFIATFTYTLVVLGSFQSGVQGSRDFVPIVSSLVALLAVYISLALFIAFVQGMIRLMRITYAIEAVADETRRAIHQTFPTQAPPDGAPPDLGRPLARLTLPRGHGVITAMDLDRLVRLARRRDCVLVVLTPIGSHVEPGTPVVEVHGQRGPSPRAIRRCLSLAAERTMLQDPQYGLRMLVDIAIRALSPAVNDPTTAVQVIDRLEDLLRRAGRRPDQDGLLRDRDGRVRVVAPVPRWEVLVNLAFTEIRRYGATSPQVVRRLLATFRDLDAGLPASRHAALERHRRLLVAAVERAEPDPAERALMLTPDRIGLGMSVTPPDEPRQPPAPESAGARPAGPAGRT